MTGLEYVISDATEPNLFVFPKQKKDCPEKVTPKLEYYILDSTIFQAPYRCSVLICCSSCLYVSSPFLFRFLCYLEGKD